MIGDLTCLLWLVKPGLFTRMSIWFQWVLWAIVFLFVKKSTSYIITKHHCWTFFVAISYTRARHWCRRRVRLHVCPIADPGFWFGRGTGRGSGTEVPQWVPGAEPRCVWVWGRSPQQNEECYVMRVKNHVLTERKNKYIHIDILWQYHNYHHLIHSSLSVSSYFCLKIQNSNNFWPWCN